jgi:hypothetical protein
MDVYPELQQMDRNAKGKNYILSTVGVHPAQVKHDANRIPGTSIARFPSRPA